MPKQSNAAAGPSTNRGKPVKIIQKTADLVKHGGKGKGKERQVLGDLTRLIGETKALPNAVQVEKFAKVRALEILAFQNAIKSAALQGSTRVFQTLPRHLRRRAASHNPRRVPKRLRSRAAAEIDPASKIAKIHRKRAKIRAKGNLRGQSRTTQFLLRQRDKSWLPTHLYHAKRFHMINLWGYRLPLSPTLKSFRSAYRATKRKCIAFDTSYYGTIELEGERDDMVELLGRMTGGPFAGPKFEDGSRFAEVSLYHFNSFPMGLIGPAEIMWCPDGNRIWIRVHPSIYTETFGAIKEAVAAESKCLVLIHDLREDLGSFEFVGPQSGRLIRRILRICRTDDKVKKQVFGNLGDSERQPRGLIAGCSVYDPRLHFPPHAIPDDPPFSTLQSIQVSKSMDPCPALASTSLWDPESREAALWPSYKKSDLDHRRRQLVVPGTKLHPLAQDDRLPVMLLAKGHSFILIFPRGWSQSIMHSIAYSATLIGGLDERQAWYRESGIPAFPQHYGHSCEAGMEWERLVAAEDQRRWLRRPPGKKIDNPTWTPDWDKVLGLSEEEAMNGQRPWLFPSILGQYSHKAEAAINAFRHQRSMASRTVSERSGLVHVQLEVEGRGSPGRMAQIYQLDRETRSKWVEAVDLGADRVYSDVSPAQQLGELVPDHNELIGYTTTGNFSLSRGCGHALGMISLRAWNEMKDAANAADDGRGVLVKVRNNGGRLCRLARVTLVTKDR